MTFFGGGAMSEDTKTIQTQEKEEMQFNGERTRDSRCFVPRSDIYEVEDAIHLVLDMPGVDEKSLDVTLEKNTLTVYGQVEPPVFEGYTPAYAEYETGDFQRNFNIQIPIDVNGIEAIYKNGVLNIRLPKDEAARTKKIAIRTN
jgi:HSP20 family molecular chaperone IbpA